MASVKASVNFGISDENDNAFCGALNLIGKIPTDEIMGWYPMIRDALLPTLLLAKCTLKSQEGIAPACVTHAVELINKMENLDNKFNNRRSYNNT